MLDAFFSKAAPSTRSSGKKSFLRSARTVPGARALSDTVEKSSPPIDESQEKLRRRPSYSSRVNLDRFLAQPEFRIKNRGQVLRSFLSIFNPPPDKVCKFFVTKRLPEIYGVLEQLVTTVRLLFPRNDEGRSAWLRVHSPFSYNVLNIIRRWNISRIATTIGRLKNHPRDVYVSELKTLIQLIYRPIVILDVVDADLHIPIIVNKLSRLIYNENDDVVFNENQKKMIRDLTSMYREVSHGVHFALYPLFMKLLCNEWHDYNIFFSECRKEIHDFLSIRKEDRVIPPKQVELVLSDSEELENPEEKEGAENQDGSSAGQSLQDRRLEKAMKDGLETLDILFPGAGWAQPQYYPDFYRYFSHIFDFERTVPRLHPENPVLQILVLSHILQNVLDGLHNTIAMSPASDTGHPLSTLIRDWQEAVELLLYRDYLRLFTEYFDYFSISARFRKRFYEKRVTNELNYFTKNHILPFFDCPIVPKDVHFSVNEENNLFSKINALYEKFDAITCDLSNTAFIGNLSDPFVFDIPTPVSKRLCSLFDIEQGTNEILITIAYEITAVLQYFINRPNSWAYTSDHYKKNFRSKEFSGIIPLGWLDESLDPDNIFRNSIELLRQRAMQKFNIETKALD